MRVVLHAKWVFARGNERVTIERCPDAGASATLAVTATDGTAHTYGFEDVLKLTAFQSDMEQFLVGTGWSLLEFAPDRRTGRDRRQFPRLVERRRWWTDALRPFTPRGSDSPSRRRRDK